MDNLLGISKHYRWDTLELIRNFPEAFGLGVFFPVGLLSALKIRCFLIGIFNGLKRNNMLLCNFNNYLSGYNMQFISRKHLKQ